MISVKRIFVTGVVSLFIVLSSSCTGKARLPTPAGKARLPAAGGCNELVCAQELKEYLEAEMPQLDIQKLDISNRGVNINSCCVDYDSIRAAINRYIDLHPECNCLIGYTLKINICPSPGACTLGFSGTMRDQDKRPRIVIEAKIIERMISAEAIRRGLMTKGIRVELKKDNKGNQFLLVSGEFIVLKGSASQGKQIVSDALKGYTAGLNIDTANLKERYAQR